MCSHWQSYTLSRSQMTEIMVNDKSYQGYEPWQIEKALSMAEMMMVSYKWTEQFGNIDVCMDVRRNGVLSTYYRPEHMIMLIKRMYGVICPTCLDVRYDHVMYTGPCLKCGARINKYVEKSIRGLGSELSEEVCNTINHPYVQTITNLWIAKQIPNVRRKLQEKLCQNA